MRSRSWLKSSALFISIFTLFLLIASPVHAAAPAAWSGICVSTKDTEVATVQGFQCLLANVLGSFLSFVGIVGFIMISVSGFRLLLSGGNSQAVEKSKSSVTFAILGLVLALSAFIILNLVAEFTGIETILNFSIPTSDTTWQ